MHQADAKVNARIRRLRVRSENALLASTLVVACSNSWMPLAEDDAPVGLGQDESMGEPEGLATPSSPPDPEPLLDDVGSGVGGFALDGDAAGNFAGYALSGVGDINGDGIDDLAVGAYTNADGGANAGHTYVVFGQASFAAGPFELGDIGGSVEGVSFHGSAQYFSGFSIDGGGDFNGDGLADLIIGARGRDNASGGTYVIFGNSALGGAGVPLYSIEYTYGTGNAFGFVIEGEWDADNSGYSVANAGDVNGDGYDDVLVGAPYADPNGSSSGRTYVVYGNDSYYGAHSVLDLQGIAQGTGGFAIDGEAAADFSGVAVDGAGDVNGDGYDDIVIGASLSDANGHDSGRVYLVYGGTVLGPQPVQLTDAALGIGGFALDGEAANDYAGRGVSAAGDVNDDGYADIIVGAHGSDGAAADQGRGYIIFGQPVVPVSPVELSTIGSGSDGIVLNGLSSADQTGWAVSAAGDANLDGLDDVLISADRRNPGLRPESGTAMLAFGGDDPGLTLEPDILDSVDASWAGGFTLDGENAGDRASFALRGIGDVNDDGVPDIGVGAPFADPNGDSSGRAYVVFGDPKRGSYHPGYNRRPQAAADVYTVAQGAALSVPAPGVLANDWDADDDPLAATADSFTTPAGSLVTIFADGGFQFSPPHDEWWGEDMFEYVVNDGTGGVATVNVWVRATPTAIPLERVAAGEGGFALEGYEAFDATGQAVAHAGDIDGDGFADVLVGAHEASPQGAVSAGMTYVVYGASSMTSPVALSPASNDAVGEAPFDWSGISVSSAGDFNGDGMDDFLIGAIGADPNGSRSGRTYVVFGSAVRPTDLLWGIDGSNGFMVDGEAAADDSGRSVARAGDVNGDGFGDLIVSAYRTDVVGQDEGRIYVIYGTDAPMGAMPLQLSDVGTTIDGYVIDGEASGDFAGFAVAGDVDVDGDGYDDVLVGAYYADPSGEASGRTYVVYGGDNIPSSMSLVDVADPMAAPDLGVAIDGEFAGDLSGRSVASAGDVNGDGLEDIIIGAPAASPSGSGSGRAYVLFGGAAFGSGGDSIVLSDIAMGTGGFALDGEGAEDGTGASVSSVGDLNGDGYGDIVVGAPLASSTSAFATGRTYVILGRPDFSTTPVIALDDVAQGVGGFVIDGELSFDSAGHAVGGGGDVNGDGFADLIVGAFNGGPQQAGRAYVIYGGRFIAPPGAP